MCCSAFNGGRVMDLINLRVRHSVYGDGIILKQDNQDLHIKFASGEIKFRYPDVFKTKMIALDLSTQEKIFDDIERDRKEVSTRLIAEKELKAAKIVEICSLAKKEAGLLANDVSESQTNGTRKTYYVFQGKTFHKEFNGGYMWAPILGADHETRHFWHSLINVQKGDIIFHGDKGFIVAISVATGTCFDCICPDEISIEYQWTTAGRRVDCDYIKLNNAIETCTLKGYIAKFYHGVKFAPFNKNGKGNHGYLYDLNRELAIIFTKAAVKRNNFLVNIDYIEELLNEKINLNC